MDVQKNMVFSSSFELLKSVINEKKREELFSDADRMDFVLFKQKWLKCSFKDKILLGIVRPIFLRLGVHRYKK